MDASSRPPLDGSPVPVPPAHKYIGSPTDSLKGVAGKRVIVRLTSGVDYQGCQIWHNCTFLKTQRCICDTEQDIRLLRPNERFL